MKTTTIALTTLAIVLTGCTTSARIDAPQSDLAAITAFNKRYLQAINDGDFVTLSSLTVKDHIMMVPNEPSIVGKAANDEANRRDFDKYRFVETWNPIDTSIDRSLAFQRGTFRSTATPKTGGEAHTYAGKFLRIYRREADGSWTMLIDSFSEDQAPK